MRTVICSIALLVCLALRAETNKVTTTDEERLLKEIPELIWTEPQFVSKGWMKPGQVLSSKGNRFSKKDVRRLGVVGEIAFLFEKQHLYDASFYIEDSTIGTDEGDADWTKLYKSVKAICTSPEVRTGDANRSSIIWTISGTNAHYEVGLVRRVFGKTLERGLEISIKPK